MNVEVLSRRSGSDAKGKGRQCTCKFIPEARLSSFTAAEYGKISSQHDWTNRKKKNLDAGGYSPLFYAAQHGHPSSTLKLLEQGWNVDGYDATCGATPLHRASFSGAISTMQILISWSCNLLAKDESFGDGMTPLHKAASGGRYLAVQLLLETLDKRGMLHSSLTLLDSNTRTPLQVARENQSISDYGSTKRWDVVAGGNADFDKCVELLEAANKQVLPLSLLNTNRKPTFLCFGGNCGDFCETTQWELSLRKSLMNNFQKCVVISSSESNKINNYKKKIDKGIGPESAANQSDTTTDKNNDENKLQQNQTIVTLCNNNYYLDDTAILPENPKQTQEKNPPAMGQHCPICNKTTFALFRNRAGQLVCRKCKSMKKPYVKAETLISL